MTRAIIDARLGKRLGRHFYPHLCTIQTATLTRGSAGSSKQTFADDASRTDLPCAVAPTGGTEVERTDQVFDRATHRIGLRDLHDDITGAERVRVGTDVFDILLVETDSQGHATYLNVELVT